MLLAATLGRARQDNRPAYVYWILASSLAAFASCRARGEEDAGDAPPEGPPAELWRRICADRKRGTSPLTLAEAFDRLWETARDGLRLTDAEGRILAVNEAYCRLAGVSRQELIGRPFTCVYPEAERQTVMQQYRSDLQHDRLRPLIERWWVTPDGRRIWVEAQLSRIELGGQVLVLASFRDATSRKELEQQLLDKIAQTRAFLASTSVGLGAVSPDGRLLRVNESLCRMLGIGAPEAGRYRWKDLVEVLHEQDAHGDSAEEGAAGQSLLCRPRYASETRQIHLELRPMGSEAGTALGYSLVAVDTSRIEKLEQRSALERRIDEALLGQIEALANSEGGEADITSTVLAILQHLGELYEADRATWYTYDFERLVCVRVLEWSRSGIASPPSAPSEFPLDLFHDWAKAHQSGQWIEIEDTSRLKDPTLRTILERRGVKSVLGVPVMSEGLCVGWIALHAVGRKRAFGPQVAAHVAAVARAVAGIRRLQSTRWELVQARDRLEAALQASERHRAEAERASRAKSEFLAAVSHEIRTPLNGVIGVLSLLGASELPAGQRQLLATAHDSAVALLGVLNDLIDMARIEAGQLELAAQEVSLLALVEESLAAVGPAAAAKGLVPCGQLESRLPESIRADRTRLRQVLLNLLGNAVKFTKEGGALLRVGLTPEGSGGALLFTVSDTGIGIPVEEQPRVFEAFYQGRGRKEGSTVGFGLGLAISRRLIEMLGGQIGVKSRPGGGSEFFFTLPFASGEGPRPQPHRPLKGKRILRIDENGFRRQALAWQLVEWGAEVVDRVEAHGPVDASLLGAGVLEKPVAEWAELVRQVKARCPKLGVVLPVTKHQEENLLRELKAEVFFEPLRWRRLLAWLGAGPAQEADQASEIWPPVRFAGRNPRVLLADDNAINRRVVKALLEKLGCEVELAANGAEVLERFAEARPDLVLLDLEMPVLDGEQTARRIRSLGHRNLPILALSAHVLPEEVQRALEAGMQDFLSKPVSLAQLDRALRQWLGILVESESAPVGKPERS
jgi:PAS domain S-box-containing protein